MSVLKSFTKDLINLAITNEDVLPVENIMLDIRIRGLMKCSPAQRRKSIIMGLPLDIRGGIIMRVLIWATLAVFSFNARGDL